MLTGYRTLIFNTLGTLVAFASLTEFQSAIPSEYLPHVLLFVTVGNGILRFITSTPVFSAK